MGKKVARSSLELLFKYNNFRIQILCKSKIEVSVNITVPNAMFW